MPRKLLHRTDRLPYHVTARANNREAFHVGTWSMWEIVGSECWRVRMLFGVEFQALVVMPNHLHMILTIPEHDLGRVMNSFMRGVARSSNYGTGRCGHVFGGPYHWSLINSFRYFGHALKYVYRNPVRAGLCLRVEDYPYSSLHGLLGRSFLPVPIHFTRVGMELNLPTAEPGEQLEWLNTSFSKNAEEQIRKGLKRAVFEEAISRRTRKHHQELRALL